MFAPLHHSRLPRGKLAILFIVFVIFWGCNPPRKSNGSSSIGSVTGIHKKIENTMKSLTLNPRPSLPTETHNETLGFEKIFILSMPERTDKQDGIAMGASLSKFTFEWIKGIKGSDIPDKALPKGWMRQWGDGALGCWRGHMDFAQKMVRENIQSALILEDDADWDISLKKQLFEFAQGSQALQYNETTSRSTPLSPYGDDWDVLWLGHCSASNRWGEDGKYYIIPEDPTVPPRENMDGSGPNRSAPSLSGNRTRFIFESAGGRCTAAYALSLRGARTLLFIQSLTVAHSIDRGLSRMCSSQELMFKCMQPWPTLIGSFRDKGDTSKDSDRVNTAGNIRQVAETTNVQYPVRLNMNRIVVGESTFKPQWPEALSGDKWGDITDELEIPEGHLEFITKDQFSAN